MFNHSITVDNRNQGAKEGGKKMTRQEAQQAAGKEMGDGVQGNAGRSERQAGLIGEGEGQVVSGRVMEGNESGERRDAGVGQGGRGATCFFRVELVRSIIEARGKGWGRVEEGREASGHRRKSG